MVPYNDGSSAPPNDPTASPRSDSTLSAPQSGQSSPKPPRYVIHNLAYFSFYFIKLCTDDARSTAKTINELRFGAVTAKTY